MDFTVGGTPQKNTSTKEWSRLIRSRLWQNNFMIVSYEMR